MAVLAGDLVGAGGVLGSELPAPGPELDPGEAPQRAGGARLVPLAPLGVSRRELAIGARRGLGTRPMREAGG